MHFLPFAKSNQLRPTLKLSALSVMVAALSGCGEDAKDCNGFWDKTFGREECAVAAIQPVSNNVVGSKNNLPSSAVASDPSKTVAQRVVVSEPKEVVAGKLDYTLSPIYCNTAELLQNQTLVVSYDDSQAQVTNSTVDAGSNSFEQCQLLSDSQATVRIDKNKAFDVDKIKVQLKAEKPLKNNSIRMTKVDFFAIGGRPGHEALLALNTQYPTSGDTVILKAFLYGNGLKATYALVGLDGKDLGKGDLTAGISGDDSAFQAQVSIPTQEFRVVLRATNSDGQMQWTTNVYKPQTSVLSLKFDDAVIKTNGQALVGYVSGKAQNTGDLVLKVHAPDGFSSDWSQKTVKVKAGETINIPYTLTAPNPIGFGQHKVFLQYRYAEGSEVLGMAKILVLVD
jgi:hypothetical protein